MNIALLGSLSGTLLGWLMGFLSLFLIMLILIQRGKGGGLTGALGGPGGQSAFGSKAGDTFTVITIVVASIWGFTCAFTMWLLGTHTPTTLTETNITAGPGDETDTSSGNELIIPPASSGFGSLDGMGGLSSGDAAADANVSETPSSEAPSTDSPAPDSPASEASETDSPASGAPEAEAPASESPAADADRPPSQDTDSDPGSDEN